MHRRLACARLGALTRGQAASSPWQLRLPSRGWGAHTGPFLTGGTQVACRVAELLGKTGRAFPPTACRARGIIKGY